MREQQPNKLRESPQMRGRLFQLASTSTTHTLAGDVIPIRPGVKTARKRDMVPNVFVFAAPDGPVRLRIVAPEKTS